MDAMFQRTKSRKTAKSAAGLRAWPILLGCFGSAAMAEAIVVNEASRSAPERWDNELHEPRCCRRCGV